MNEERPEEKKRSRRIYVYWGVALGLLLSMLLIGWLGILPLMQVHHALKDFGLGDEEWEGVAAIERLGGQEKAAERIVAYIELPMVGDAAEDKLRAVRAFSLCGPWGEEHIERLTRAEHPLVRQEAIAALKKIRAGAPPPR